MWRKIAYGLPDTSYNHPNRDLEMPPMYPTPPPTPGKNTTPSPSFPHSQFRLWLKSKQTKTWLANIKPHLRTTKVSGLPFRDCAASPNNFGPRWPKLSPIDVTAKIFFECLYLVPGLAPICALCHHALGAHTPTSHSTNISRFLCNCLPEWPLNFFVITIHEVIWPSFLQSTH